MAQHDLNIANQSFPSFRSDLNNALSAIQTTHSGTSTPTGAVAGQIWLDTTSATTPTLKYYDGTDNISLATIDHVGNTVNWLDSTVSITGISTTATGTVLTLTDSASTSTVNLIIDNQKEIRFRETTANGTNYVALKAPASVSADLTFTLPSADGTAGQFLKTDGAGSLSFINPPTGFRNIVINGDMQIAQRSTSVASLTSTAYTYETLDRWFFSRTADCGTWTMSQSTDVPSGEGFARSLKLDCTATASVSGASTDLRIIQKFEGQNLQYLKYGTANAQSKTLSFWVKSTKTGTFIVELNSKDTRSISKSYTVNTTNTWEKKTITFSGDTSGVIDNDNSEELSAIFWLVAGSTFSSGTLNTSWGSMTNANRAVGQVNIGDNTSNDWLITGVQLEAGTSATDFEFLPIDVSLGRCLRYIEFIGGIADAGIASGGTTASTTSSVVIHHMTTMRAAPTVAFNDVKITDNVGYDKTVTAIAAQASSVNTSRVFFTHDSGATQFRPAYLNPTSTSSTSGVTLNSEL